MREIVKGLIVTLLLMAGGVVLVATVISGGLHSQLIVEWLTIGFRLTASIIKEVGVVVWSILQSI